MLACTFCLPQTSLPAQHICRQQQTEYMRKASMVQISSRHMRLSLSCNDAMLRLAAVLQALQMAAISARSGMAGVMCRC